MLKMTYLIMYSHTCKTRQTRRHSPSRLPRTRYIRQTFANPFPRTRHIRQTFANPFPRTRHIRHSIHSPAFAKMRLAFDTFARVIRHFGEFGASGHCLLFLHFISISELFKKKYISILISILNSGIKFISLFFEGHFVVRCY